MEGEIYHTGSNQHESLSGIETPVFSLSKMMFCWNPCSNQHESLSGIETLINQQQQQEATTTKVLINMNPYQGLKLGANPPQGLHHWQGVLINMNPYQGLKQFDKPH